jgi:hypothetical protein
VVRPIIVHQTFASFASSSEIVGATRIEIPVSSNAQEDEPEYNALVFEVKKGNLA